MGNDGVKCALSQGNFPLPRDFWPFFQNCHVEYFYREKEGYASNIAHLK